MNFYTLKEIESFQRPEVTLMIVPYQDFKNKEKQGKKKIICRVDENTEKHLILKSVEPHLVRIWKTEKFISSSKHLFALPKKKTKFFNRYFLAREEPAIWASDENHFAIIEKKLERVEWMLR